MFSGLPPFHGVLVPVAVSVFPVPGSSAASPPPVYVSPLAEFSLFLPPKDLLVFLELNEK